MGDLCWQGERDIGDGIVGGRYETRGPEGPEALT